MPPGASLCGEVWMSRSSRDPPSERFNCVPRLVRWRSAGGHRFVARSKYCCGRPTSHCKRAGRHLVYFLDRHCVPPHGDDRRPDLRQIVRYLRSAPHADVEHVGLSRHHDSLQPRQHHAAVDRGESSPRPRRGRTRDAVPEHHRRPGGPAAARPLSALLVISWTIILQNEVSDRRVRRVSCH